MLVLKDKRNNNLYLVGKIDGKDYLLNGVCKFELTEERLKHLENIGIDYNISNNNILINDTVVKIKKYMGKDFDKIEFQ